MKSRIAMAALILVAAAIAVPSSVPAKHAAPLGQPPAQSSAEPAQSVWGGVYTVEQASRGGALYAQRCARCHGQDLTGGEIAPALNSGEFKSNWTGLTIDDLLERIKVSMPQDNPGSLSRQQTADVVAFVLSRNGFPGGRTELAREAEVLKTIRFEQNKPETAGASVTPRPLESDAVVVKMTTEHMFVPEKITVAVGQTVEWVNDDKASTHQVTTDPDVAVDPSHVSMPEGVAPFDSRLITSGKSFRHQFTVPGLYRYACPPHENDGMLGEVTVTK